MRRYRRLVLIDRIIPFLAAVVGLVALAGAVSVQLSTDAKTAAVTAAVAELRSSVDALGQQTAALAVPADDGTAAGLLALQDRMTKLQGEWDAQKTALAATPVAAPAAAAATTTTAEIDPNLPTTDCIPLGTRFMVLPDDSYPICQSKAVIKTGAITADTIYFDGAGAVVETGFGSLPGTSCTVMVFQADEAGFGEVRVTCT
ncbi:hypothetical protein [Devosia sp. CN2-171]|jgi:outer membrane murein-binding lipoprotein Lpp|uniref:hypothetical protein n=1 Tax=Devosia sp. CN2-171 TaxID=3400909 RepID=UPI003BF83C5E